MKTKEKIFVTGGSGFVGRNLIRQLITGGYEVYALVRSDKAQQIVTTIGAKVVYGDLANIDKMKNVMQECTTIYHLAANTNSNTTEEVLYKDNVIGTQNVIEAAKCAKTPLLIFVSSDAVVVGKEPLINIDEKQKTPKQFCGNYAKTKSLSEKCVIQANDNYLRTVVVRVRLIWGNDDDKFLPSLCRKVDKGIFFWINNGRYLTSTCHVYNVCCGLIQAKKYGHGGEIYFLTDGAPIEFRSFVTSLLATKGIPPPKKNLSFRTAQKILSIIKIVFRSINKTAPVSNESLYLLGMQITLNQSKAIREINYRPSISIQEGLNELYEINKNKNR